MRVVVCGACLPLSERNRCDALVIRERSRVAYNDEGCRCCCRWCASPVIRERCNVAFNAEVCKSGGPGKGNSERCCAPCKYSSQERAGTLDDDEADREGEASNEVCAKRVKKGFTKNTHALCNDKCG